MATTLSTRQGLLTRAVNKLASTLEANKDWTTTTLQPPLEEAERRTYVRGERLKFRKAKAILESETLNVDNALERYSSAADGLDSDTPSLEEILKKVNSNIETAATTLDKGRTMLTTMAHFLEELDEIEEASINTVHINSSESPQMQLAPIPIPKFSGRIWEWDTFWGAFKHSVDSREMDDLYKMNYLLDALQGEARETVKQFEVSGRTYPLVIAHLKEKYGNSQALVSHMVRRLQRARAHSERLEHQEKLLEELSSIVSQLHLKGENVDNCFLQDQLLGKFTKGIQRHVLRTKEQQLPNDIWNTTTLLNCAKEYIRTELKIATRVGETHDQRSTQEPAIDRRNPRAGRRIISSSKRQDSCFYCGKGDHSAKDCSEIATREERLTFMRKRNLCLNCGSGEHWAEQCRGGSCRLCRKHGHHTSLCQQLSSLTKTPSATRESRKPPSTSNKSTPKRTVQKSSTSSKMNTVVSEPQQAFDEVPNAAAFVNLQRSIADVHILVGQAQVLNPKDQALESIHVLLDTGADRSFICNELADRLQLRDISSTKLTINTFGSRQPLQRTCGITQLQMWDTYGQSHRVTVTKIETVTEPILRRRLSEEDRRFLYENNIRLSINADIMELKPQVLLGCADLYPFLEGGLAKQKTLPSGLTLIPSKLGYLVSGYETVPEKKMTEQSHVDTEVMTTTSDTIEEAQTWEQFCTFESTGVHEFTGPITTATTSSSELLDWSRHNRLPSAKRTLAYVLRFIHGLSLKVDADLRRRLESSIPELNHMTTEAYVTAEENEMALRVLVRHHQQSYFTEEQLKALKQLNIRRDEFGIIRCQDPSVPRNLWKLGRIVSISNSNTEKIREVQLKLPSGHIVRRPVNALFPLELEDTRNEPSPSTAESQKTRRNLEEPESKPRYELRPRKRVNYSEDPVHCATIRSSTMRSIPVKSLLACITVIMLTAGVTPTATAIGQMSCLPGGVSITIRNIERYEVCAEHHCYVKERPQGNETILFPPEVLLHEHNVQLKLFDGQNFTVLETSCPPELFCDHIRCWFCTANIFNPECSPRTAIAAITITLYILIASLYALCFVPMVIGKPCRIISKAVWTMCKAIGYLLWKICCKWPTNRRRRYDVEALLRAPLLAIICMIALARSSYACQDIDVFFYRDSICTLSAKGIKKCALETTELVKLNSFSQDACIRLTNQQSVEKEIRIQWKGLRLITTTSTKTTDKQTIRVRPTVPLKLNGMRITLTSLSFPPTPALSSSFISVGSEVAIWTHKERPHLICESEDNANSLNCSVTTDCDCEPAEDKVNCMCTDFKITNVFSKEIENRFPIRRPWITFTTAKEDSTAVVAQIPSFTTAELLIHLKEEFDKTIRVITNSICTVPDSVAKGCYQCLQGASAKVTCTTNGDNTMATITCDDQTFTVPCHKEGYTSTLRFTHSSARLMKRCNVSCGDAESFAFLAMDKPKKMSSATTETEVTAATPPAKVDKLVLKMDVVMARLNQMETPKEIQEEIEGLHSKVDALNIPQLFTDVSALCTLSEMSSTNVIGRNARSSAPVEPSPEMERILHQMGETERELREARDALLEVNNSIEKERQEGKGRVGSARLIDDLKERRTRLQAREDRVEREMRDLERRLERVKAVSSRQQREHYSPRTHEESRMSRDSHSSGRDQDIHRGGRRGRRGSSTRSTDSHHRTDQGAPSTP
ncbi:zinc knuckle [Ostertagia ostertagi]